MPISLQRAETLVSREARQVGMIEYFMKHIQTRDTLRLWADFLYIFKDAVLLDKERGYIYIKHLLWYTDSKVPEDKQQELNNLILDNLNKTDGKDIMRSVAQKYIEEGEQKGRLEGLEKTAISMLKEKLEESLIARVTSLSVEHIAKLKATL